MTTDSLRRWLDGVVQDIHYGARALRRTPLATAVMVASVALGIGVTTAVFTLADVMLFRPLPYRKAEQLVVPYQTVAARAGARRDTLEWSFARYGVLRESVRGFEDLGFASWVDGLLRVSDGEKPVRIEAITASLLTTFRIVPQRGRPFQPDEDAVVVPQTVAMISDRLWRTAFANDPSILGGTITINAKPVTVVGIMPPGFTGYTVGADVWLPVRMMARIDPSDRWTDRLARQSGTVIARVIEGMTVVRLQKQLEAALPIINERVPERFVAPDSERGVGVMTLADARRHPLVKPLLTLMGVAVASLLLIVCANVASLLLARGHSRRGELGVRIAMGASQGRLGRQVLTESLLLAALALPPGVLLGFFCADALAAVRPNLPQSWVLLRGTDLLAGASLAPNLRVLVFSTIVAAVAALFFGVGPAVAATRVNAARLLTSSGDAHTSPPMRGRQALVTTQVALATILLLTAGLMTRSLIELLRADLGFDPTGVVAFRLTSTDTSASARIRRQQLLETLEKSGNVTSLATSGCLPFDIACLWTLDVRALGSLDASARPVDVEFHTMSPGYFRAMRIQFVSGRPLTAEDTIIGRRAVILSETAARRLFGTSSLEHRQIAFAEGASSPMDVVGVVRDVRFKSVETAASPAIYLLAGEQAGAPRLSEMLFVRTDLPTGDAIAAVTREIRRSGAPVSVGEARSLSDVVRDGTSTTRFVAMVLGAFAITAAFLAGLGIYGVIAYVVSQRTREFGIRIVLGADGRDLLQPIMRQGSALVFSGVAAGVLLAMGAVRLIASMLYGVASGDPSTYGATIAVVALVGLTATLIPALRIRRIDPAQALKAEGS